MKNIGECGLRKSYKDNAEFRYHFRKYMMLMLLPIDSVQDGWDALGEYGRLKQIVPEESILH